MFSVGGFAQAGTGSRSYEAAQLAELNRIVAPKELGFALEQVRSIVADMDAVIPAVQALARWIDANGYRSLGYNRELYIECWPEFVTELPEPVTAR